MGLKNKIFLILVLVCVVLVAVAYFSIKKNIQLAKENAELKKRKEKNETIDAQTMQTIDGLHTGNPQHDFDNGLNVLHDLAQKR